MPQGITRSSIEGFDKVIKAFNVEILIMTNNSRKGLRLCAIEIQRDVEGTEPLIPELTGNLRSSWRTFAVHDGPVGDRRYGLRFGYSANYALWVHEMMEATNWTRSGSGAKWLEKSINRNHDTFINIIASASAVKR